MQRYIAFLSGLPVGGESVTAQTLRSLFLKLGFVVNWEGEGLAELQLGAAVFDGPALYLLRSRDGGWSLDAYDVAIAGGGPAGLGAAPGG